MQAHLDALGLCQEEFDKVAAFAAVVVNRSRWTKAKPEKNQQQPTATNMSSTSKKAMEVRAVDVPFLGQPKRLDEIPDCLMKLLEGKNICCPGCHAQNFNQDPQFAAFITPCHTNALVNEFALRFPTLKPPTQLSLATKDVAELRRVLLDENAVFCGVCPKRGAPTRSAGVKLERTIFGNPHILACRVDAAERDLARAKRVLGKRGGSACEARVGRAQKKVARASAAVVKADAFVCPNA